MDGDKEDDMNSHRSFREKRPSDKAGGRPEQASSTGFPSDLPARPLMKQTSNADLDL